MFQVLTRRLEKFVPAPSARLDVVRFRFLLLLIQCATTLVIKENVIALNFWEKVRMKGDFPSTAPLFLAVCWALIALPNSRCFSQSTEPQIAATVADSVVTVEHVEKLLARSLDDRPLSEPVKALMQAKALDQLVGQLLVLEYLRSQGKIASDDDVQLSLERLQEELGTVEQSLEHYLVEQGLTRSALVSQIRFRLSWARYLESSLTDENLHKHFDRFRRELDGTQVNVSHLLLKEDAKDPENLAEVENQAEQIRSRVLKGEVEWLEAVREHSQAASRESGGDLGWIGRWSPMPESFSKAAFSLEPGQISPPTRTEFGVHLIRCEVIEPGTSAWEKVEPVVRRHSTQYLFEWIVERQRVKTPPSYSGVFPTLDAITGQVIGAKPSVTPLTK